MLTLSRPGATRRSFAPYAAAIGLILLLAGGLWLAIRFTRGRSTARQEAARQAAVQAEAEAEAALRARDPGPALLAEARQIQVRGDLSAAREKAYEALAAATQPAGRAACEAYLGDLNIQTVMNPHPMAEKVDYTIARGDMLAVLARRFKTTVELIAKSNNIRGSNIRPGDRLRILSGTFRIEVSLSENSLTLLLNDRFFKRYRVGTGQYQKTPPGEFQITDRIAQPTWWRPDGKEIPFGHPDNVLGTHWLSLNLKGYGIHGTWQPESIGKQESAGCVRLLNPDIEELFTLLPVGVAVRIAP
jgi:lipoprotein-anchoring transpeptidase ErfK/SrfK